jgi:hypothetical protein
VADTSAPRSFASAAIGDGAGTGVLLTACCAKARLPNPERTKRSEARGVTHVFVRPNLNKFEVKTKATLSPPVQDKRQLIDLPRKSQTLADWRSSTGFAFRFRIELMHLA